MRVDLNADIGEASGAEAARDDERLLAIVTSANIACGFHAGDPATMRRTVELAARAGVAVGAHPSFADRAGFGRHDVQMDPEEIVDLVVYQLGALSAVAHAQGVRLQHVKPHGALYNMSARQSAVAAAIARAVASFDESLVVFGLPDSELESAAEKLGLTFAAEGFADRTYEPDGSLTSRQIAGSVITDPGWAAERAVQMIREHRIVARDGKEVTLRVDTICVHGDTPGAVNVAREVRRALEQAGVTIAAPVAAP